MRKGSMDRRVARTRTLLQQAHLALIRQKGYDATTVEDICRAANVGRSTFYAHFAGKDDLKRSGFERLRQELGGHRDAPAACGRPPALGFSLPMFEHARDHIDLYRALVGSGGGTIALAAIRRILSDLLRTELAGSARDPVPAELVVEYLVGAYMALLTWWLDGGAKLPPQQMDAAFRRLATHGIAQLAPSAPA